MSCLDKYIEHKLRQSADRYVQQDIDSIRKMSPKVEGGRNNNEIKKLTDAKVVIGGMMYPVRDLDFIQDPDRDYPHVRASAVLNPFYGSIVPLGVSKTSKNPDIVNVIFNPPATIVFWSDNTKTVVKCDYDQERYDPEKGIAMAIAKKMMGDNKYEYYNVFKHWLKKWDKQHKQASTIDDCFAPGEWDGDFANL